MLQPGKLQENQEEVAAECQAPNQRQVTAPPRPGMPAWEGGTGTAPLHAPRKGSRGPGAARKGQEPGAHDDGHHRPAALSHRVEEEEVSTTWPPRGHNGWATDQGTASNGYSNDQEQAAGG